MVVFDLVNEDILKAISGKKIIGLRLKSVHGIGWAPDCSFCYLEVEVEE